MNQTEFIEEIYGNKSDDAWIHVWHLKNKVPFFYKTTADVIDHFKKHERDVYIAPCLRKEKLEHGQPGGRRGGYDDIHGMVALYIDIDYANDAHKKTSLPPDRDSAINLIKTGELDPTVIVFTGHGIQGWWVFKEEWTLDSEAEKEQAQKLNQKLHSWVAGRALEKGWECDNISDLARICRPPGTLNCKNGSEIRTEVIFANGNRYNPEDVEEFLQDVPDVTIKKVATIKEIAKKTGKITLDPAAVLDDDAKEHMKDVYDVDFTQMFNRKKTAVSDSSASGSDYSLAIMGLRAGLKSQQVADMIIESRREAKQNLKLNNEQYYTRTIFNAGEIVKQEEEEKRILESKPDDNEKINNNRIAVIKKWLSNKMGMKVLEFRRILGNPMIYELDLEVDGKKKEAQFPATARLNNQTSFENIIIEATRKVPVFKFSKPKKDKDPGIKSQWLEFIQRMLDIAIDIEGFEERFLKLHVRRMIIEYLANYEVVTMNEGYPDKLPFVKKGRWNLYSEKFNPYLENNGTKLTPNELWDVFRKLEGSHEHHRPKHPDTGKSTTTRPWSFPPSVIPISS